jgi:prepilin-type N-terminal cleavage/methylation domain-containing protein
MSDTKQSELPMEQRIRRSDMKKQSGFTLIELMIVVVIIGVLAGLVAPALMGKHSKKNGAVQEPVHSPKAVEKAAEPESVVPETVSARLQIHLAAKSVIRQQKVYTIFDASFQGSYTFVNKKDQQRIRLYFPFPESTTQAKDVMLRIRYDSGEWTEPEGVSYTLSGIRWIGLLEKNKSVSAEVRYNAQGYDRYVYDGPGSGRAGALKIDMFLDGLTSEFIPEEALQPTTTEQGHLIWDIRNLISGRKIVVELPGTMSPTGRLMLFLRLAALAVFLFGLGFSYLNDLEGPGRLDHFRLGHFLLLAITYSLFFVIFTALQMEKEMNPYTSLLISGGLSVPLLLIHVSRFWGKRFAVRAILPLALFTLAVVVNGVYGGEYRIFIYIGLIVGAAAFFTMTYSTWIEKRKQHREETQKQIKEARNQELKTELKETDSKFETLHCISCGASYPYSRFCPRCGIRSPVRLICGKCGEMYMLPVHLVDKDKIAVPVCCMTCGQHHSSYGG